MQLWQAAVLFVIIAAASGGMIRYIRRRGRKAWAIAAVVVLTLSLIAVAVYCLAALLLLGADR
jgi:cobalamin biosynthesis protein CbiG